jgi:hypothetical protein
MGLLLPFSETGRGPAAGFDDIRIFALPGCHADYRQPAPDCHTGIVIDAKIDIHPHCGEINPGQIEETDLDMSITCPADYLTVPTLVQHINGS